MSQVVSVGYSEYQHPIELRTHTDQIQAYLRHIQPKFERSVKQAYPNEMPPIDLSSDFNAITKATAHIKQFNIFKQPRDFITLEPGGVVGDSHFHPHVYEKVDNDLFVIKWIAEVNLFRSEELERLNNMFSTNIGPGGVGENILTSGIDIDALPVDTILKIGPTAQVQLLARRTLCYKLVNVFLPERRTWTKADRNIFDRTKIGMTGQVIQSGVVQAGDPIEVVLPDVNTGPIPLEFGSPPKFTKVKVIDNQQS